MLQFLFSRAQRFIDHSIDAAVRRVIVAVPIIIAGGFLAAALSVWLNRELGAELGHLVMAGIFALLAGIVAVIPLMNRDQPASEDTGADSASTSREQPFEAAQPFSASDRELNLSLASTLAPAALPHLLRLLLRNLPVVAVVAVIAYVLSRPARAEPTAGAGGG